VSRKKRLVKWASVFRNDDLMSFSVSRRYFVDMIHNCALRCCFFFASLAFASFVLSVRWPASGFHVVLLDWAH
jgi:hypothetical protein